MTGDGQVFDDGPEPGRYAPKDIGRLVLLSHDEHRLIEALRADPDQEAHIVDCHTGIQLGGYITTVRHPVSERLLADALFACPVLDFAQAWLDDEEDPVGRWRYVTDAAGSAELVKMSS